MTEETRYRVTMTALGVLILIRFEKLMLAISKHRKQLAKKEPK